MVDIEELLQVYGSIAKIPDATLKGTGFSKVDLGGGSFRLVRADNKLVPLVPYPLRTQTKEDQELVTYARSASAVPLLAVPAFGKHLPVQNFQGASFGYHGILAENPVFWRGKHILDVGCMYDRFAYSLTELLGDDFTYTGVECNSVVYEHPEHTKGKPHITFHEGAGYQVTCVAMSPKSVDILCTFGLAISPEDYKRILRPILRDDGFLFLDSPLITSLEKYPFARRKYEIPGFALRQQIWVQQPSPGSSLTESSDFIRGISIYTKK